MRNDPEFVELVTIVESNNTTLLTLVKSVLDGDDIPYFAKGEQLQHLFGFGQLGVGFNPIIGPVRIQVRSDDAQRARVLLRDFLETGETEGGE